MAGGSPEKRLARYSAKKHIRSPRDYFASLVKAVGPIFTDSAWPQGRLGNFLTGQIRLPERHFDPHDAAPPPMSWAFEDYIFYMASQTPVPRSRQRELGEVLVVKLAAVLELQPDVREISPEDLAGLSSEARLILPFRDKLLGNYDSLFTLTPHKKPDGEIEYVYWEPDRRRAIENLFILTGSFPSPEHILPRLEQMRARDTFPKDYHMDFDNWLRIAMEIHSKPDSAPV